MDDIQLQNKKLTPENDEFQNATDLVNYDSEIPILDTTKESSEKTYNSRKNKRLRLRIFLCVVSGLLIVSIILAFFSYSTYSRAYSNAESKYESLSNSIAKMEISQKDLECADSLENKLYEKHFKEKNEQDIINLLKRNFYTSSSNLVNTDSISNIKKVQKVCEEFGLDEAKYADVYLYINTVLKLEEHSKYNTLSKHLDDTVPLLASINTSSYYTIEMVASTLQQCIDSLTMILKMIQGDMTDSQVYRYYEIVIELGECIIDAVKAGQKNDINTMKQKIREYSFTLLELYELNDEVEEVKKEVIASIAELIEIEKRINMQ